MLWKKSVLKYTKNFKKTVLKYPNNHCLFSPKVLNKMLLVLTSRPEIDGNIKHVTSDIYTRFSRQLR